jgi:hypothetical protein
MGWNHRLIATEHINRDGYVEIYFQIHEVYYDNEGNPEGYTENGVSVGSDSIEGIEWTLNKMKECLDKPILCGDNKFPQEYVPKC